MSTVSIETITERINTMMAYQTIADDNDRIAQMICDITAMRLNLVDRNQQIAELLEKLRHISQVAHYGGLINLSENDVLVCIRKITIQYMPKSEKELKWSEIQELEVF